MPYRAALRLERLWKGPTTSHPGRAGDGAIAGGEGGLVRRVHDWTCRQITPDSRHQMTGSRQVWRREELPETSRPLGSGTGAPKRHQRAGGVVTPPADERIACRTELRRSGSRPLRGSADTMHNAHAKTGAPRSSEGWLGSQPCFSRCRTSSRSTDMGQSVDLPLVRPQPTLRSGST
jgi:hypothetical protein